MSTSFKISSITEPLKKRTKLFADIWSRRVNFVLSQLVSARLSLGIKGHEGELGLAISKFVRETFRSISITRKIERLTSSSLGKAFISKIILDNVPESKRSLVLNDIKKIADFSKLEFIEGIKKILEKHLNPVELRRLDTILGNRLAHALVSRDAVFDVIDNKLYAIDNATGEIIEKKLDLKKSNDVVELLAHGVLDKNKDLYTDFAEWRMLKIIDEGMQKGLKGKDLGIYVHHRLREELMKDELFQYCFNYYLTNHYNNLEKSRTLMVAFGDLVLAYVKLYRKLATAVARAASTIPIFGSIAEATASLGEAVSETGESN